MEEAISARADEYSRQLAVERAARISAEQLQQLGAALSLATTAEEVAVAATDRVQKVFERASGVVIGRCDSRRNDLELIRATDMAPEVFEQWRRIPLSAHTPLTDVCRTGIPVFLESREDWKQQYPDLVPVVEQSPHAAQMVVPLIAAGRPVGSMGIAFREQRRFTSEEREFVVSVAGQCAIAFERARLFEAERDARAAAETANRAKADFLAAMSHELRTPLNAIAGHVDLLAFQLYGPLTDEQRGALERIKRAEQHLLGVIDDLLSFARLEHGKIEFHLTNVVVAEVIEDITPMIRQQVGASGLRLSTVVSDAAIAVRADRGKLIQVLLNLLGNAVKFTPQGGSVDLAVTSANGTAAHGEMVSISVTNTGIGIPPDKVEAVFDPFVQLETALSDRRQGTGLGLAISRDLARGMGGELTVASDPGNYTIFTLVLPRAGAEAGA